MNRANLSLISDKGGTQSEMAYSIAQSRHIQLSPEAEVLLEAGGRVKKETQQDRDRVIKAFKEYVQLEDSRSVQALLLKDDKSEDLVKSDLEVLSCTFTKYFWTLRLEVSVRKHVEINLEMKQKMFQEKQADGSVKKIQRKPMASYAKKMRSQIKNEIIKE